MSYARKNIASIDGYVPGEQPQGRKYIKLNTNENPYPPTAKVLEALRDFDGSRFRLYSEPSARMVREAASEVFGVPPEGILCGNGSDDLLTIALRTFVDQGGCLAYSSPSYSLYPVLADLQGAEKCPVELDENFNLPENAAELAGKATLFLLCRPNAPTGNTFCRERVEKLCREFQGVVWIDEAYADFANDNCVDFVGRFPNVIVSRTMSKSYSLAGLRLGIAMGSRELINEMYKVKDSYNVDMITQYLGAAALRDTAAMREQVAKVKNTRDWLRARLLELGCRVLPSESNFLFVNPVRRPAAEIFRELKDNGILVRYFALPRVSDFIRITIGTDEDMKVFLDLFKQLLNK